MKIEIPNEKLLSMRLDVYLALVNATGRGCAASAAEYAQAAVTVTDILQSVTSPKSQRDRRKRSR